MTRVLIEPDHRLPLVSLAMSFPVGAAMDPEPMVGLSGLAIRMLKRGCPGFSEEELEARLDELGAELETGSGLRSSWVACEVLTRSLDEVIALLCRMFAEPYQDAEPLGRLQRETLAEITESQNDDSSLAGRALRRAIFSGHPHARFPLGRTDTVPSIELDDLRRHGAKYYGRQSAVFVFSGDITPEKAERTAEQLSAALAEVSAPLVSSPEPGLRAGRHFSLVDKGARNQAQLVLGMPGTKPTDEDHTALCVANTAFGGTYTSRLMKEIRTERGWSYGAASQLLMSPIREAFSCHSAPSTEDAADCLALMVKLVEDWHREGLSVEELEFCKGYLRRSHAFEIDTPKKRVQRKLRDVLLGLGPDFDGEYLERLAAVTLEDANAAVRRRIDPKAMCVAAVASDEECGEALRGAIEDLQSSEILPVSFE